MRAKEPTSTWLPDRPPTWGDVVLAFLAIAWIPLNVDSAGELRWPWLVIGFVSIAIILGPVANTSTGRRLEAWYRSIGYSGRTVVVACLLTVLAIAIRVATRFTSISLSHAESFAAGAFLAGLVLIVAHLASWREIDGWRGDESTEAR